MASTTLGLGRILAAVIVANIAVAALPVWVTTPEDGRRTTRSNPSQIDTSSPAFRHHTIPSGAQTIPAIGAASTKPADTTPPRPVAGRPSH